MSAPKVDVGLFFVEVQQSIVAVGTFCDDLDKLTIASEPARDKLTELLGRSIEASNAFYELIEAQSQLLKLIDRGTSADYRALQESVSVRRSRAALARVGGDV